MYLVCKELMCPLAKPYFNSTIQMEWISLDWWMHSQAGQLWGAEARIGLCAASTFLGGDAGSHGAGNGVAGASGVLQGLLRYDLAQRMLCLYLEEVWLLSLVLTDPKQERECASVSVQCHLFTSLLLFDHYSCQLFVSPNQMLCYH